MAVHVTPSALAGPLPGGQAGTTVTVEPIIAGQVEMVTQTVEGDGGMMGSLRRFVSADRTVYPCPVFLIRHPGAGPVLVDTGFHPSVVNDPKHSFGRALNFALRPSLESGSDVVSQLRARGIDPSQVTTVILTHLHADHASAISELPDATFVVSEPEWEAAIQPRSLTQGYRHAQFDHAFDYRTVSYDGPLVRSYATFGRTFDLFGDGSVRLVFTPGHTVGHQSVICRLKANDFMIGGDAAYLMRQIEDRNAPLPQVVDDEHNYRRSLREIQLFREQYPDAIVTPGHDPEFFAAAEERYE